MRSSTKWLWAGGSAGIAAAAAATYGLVVRPRHLVWGATSEEIARPLPFDSLIESPNYFTTRALTIEAGRDEVWPFLIDRNLLPAGTEILQMVERESALFANPEFEEEATWVVVLEELPGNRTRLISRNRARFSSRPAAVVRYLRIDPAHFVRERKWLIRIRERAEDLSRSMRLAAMDEGTGVADIQDEPAAAEAALPEVEVPVA